MKFKTILLSALTKTSGCQKLYPHKTEYIDQTVTVTESVRDTVIQV